MTDVIKFYLIKSPMFARNPFVAITDVSIFYGSLPRDEKNFHIKSHQLFHSLNGFLFQLFGKCIKLVLLVDNVHTAVNSH